MGELLVEKVGEQLIATGAQFSHGGQEYHRPCIKRGHPLRPVTSTLELSGIGSPGILETAGIVVKVASVNVGENLKEHMSEFTFSGIAIHSIKAKPKYSYCKSDL